MTFHAQFLLAIDGWEKDPIEDQWLFEKFRDQIVNLMPAAEAFEAIGEAIDVLLLQSDELTAIEVAQTLNALARQSDTTEIPSKLLAQKPAIVSRFSIFGDYAKSKLQELFQHYRL